MSPVTSSGSREGDALTPLGEYANSCVGRERVLEHLSRTQGTPMSIIRLNYAVDLRYGVLVDIAHKIMAGEPVRLEMGFVNVIWQGDASALAICSLAQSLFGQPTISTDTLIAWVGDWVGRGGTKLGKETKFEVRDGRY
jgi:hypothetical protein